LITTADYIVNFLIKEDVTDVFGIPGGVILDLIYAIHKWRPAIEPHLSYHEQAAALSACGYAQVSGKLGVAYATRGPGMTNFVTGIAEAFYESLPILFITAHAQIGNKLMRAEYDQELDPIPMISNIVKYAKRIDSAEDVPYELSKACFLAKNGRKGPVLLDFASHILGENIVDNPQVYTQKEIKTDFSEIIETIKQKIKHSKRPIILIGDGIRQSNTQVYLKTFAENNNIPILSSRSSQDIAALVPLYFGYIGSHGIRTSNFILSKADFILAIGNRMHFPIKSQSFAPLFKNTETIRIDIDETEFLRKVPNSLTFKADLKDFMPCFAKQKFAYSEYPQWLNVCQKLQAKLNDSDMTSPSSIISSILKQLNENEVITSDVGNNEFWFSRAYYYSKNKNPILYSKSFGTLGSALPKAIGAYYETLKPVTCFVGDQGFQLNLQELASIGKNKLPIQIIILNNHTSGMIKDREAQKYNSEFVHTTQNDGYYVPNLQKIAEAYGLNYYFYHTNDIMFENIIRPSIIEIEIDENVSLIPQLKKGDSCQNLYPYLSPNLLEELNKL